MKKNLQLGQHFMVDENLLKEIAVAAHITLTDDVVEIGSGHGALTRYLYAANPRTLVCIEKDKRFTLPVPVRLITGDVLEVIDQLSFNKVVANIPYHISEPLFIKLLLHKPHQIILVVGKTFAQKLLGKTILGLVAQSQYTIEHIKDIPPTVFSPAPKTTSALIVATVKQTSLTPFLSSFYTHQRQKVKNYILTVTKDLITKREIRNRMTDLNLLLDKQLYTLSTSEFMQLYTFLCTLVN
ncbi:hypothetical protein K9M74_02010 [Candidatus Woesearchaeota archaeon]|nr:hypothetical protein [Candidatus Woesearchaeota archaeon]